MRNTHGPVRDKPNRLNSAPLRPCIQPMAPIAMTSAPMEPISGHGLGVDDVVIVILGGSVGHIVSSSWLLTKAQAGVRHVCRPVSGRGRLRFNPQCCRPSARVSDSCLRDDISLRMHHILEKRVGQVIRPDPLTGIINDRSTKNTTAVSIDTPATADIFGEAEAFRSC